MAVDTAQIGTVYTALETKMLNTLDTLLNNHIMKESERAQVISNAIVALIQTSAQIVSDEQVKASQKAMIDAQKLVEDAKKILTDRQATYYNDQLRMAEAKELSGMVQMGLAGGTTLPSDLLTKTYNAIDAITQ